MFASLIFGAAVVTEFQEALYPEWRQTFAVEEMIAQEKTKFWDLAIFENKIFGKVMAIDGIVQITEKDEGAYHEMLVHVPLLSHSNPKSVLIIGGGDGGILREVLRHENIERVVQVEIDKTIIELSKKYFPSVSNGAFEDPRAKIVIQDGAHFVKTSEERFDVVIVDSNDPEGPAKMLFTSEFYGDCKKILHRNGILVNQNGVPFLQKEELHLTEERRKPHFKNVTFYVASVPSYTGGLMALGWASDMKYRVSEKILQERLSKIKGKMHYYTPQIHKASFALPQFMMER